MKLLDAHRLLEQLLNMYFRVRVGGVRFEKGLGDEGVGVDDV